jgi:hypothetical protein
MTVVLAGMMGPPQFGSYTQTFNRIYPDLAEQHGTYLYPFLLNGVALVERYNQRDGIHPNAGGRAPDRGWPCARGGRSDPARAGNRSRGG